MRCENLDTVLGLSITPTTLGWVLAEGHGADGAILDRNELELHSGRNAQAIHTAEQLAAEVLLAHEVAAAGDHRLRVIGVTWNAEASAQAALLVESLTGAGFDNVVPVRRLRAIETLAQAIAPVIGYEQIAVCVLEHESATVVMVDTHDGKTQIAVKHVCRGLSGLTSWLTGMFGRDAWRPAGVVVVGSDSEVSEFSWHARVTRRKSRANSDRIQLTIDNKIAAQIAVHQKWSICSPQWVVCSVIHAVSHSIDALTTTWKRPRVRMYNGIDKICTMGLMNALTRPKITATTKMMATRCSVVSPPANRMPGTKRVTNRQRSADRCSVGAGDPRGMDRFAVADGRGSRKHRGSTGRIRQGDQPRHRAQSFLHG